MLNHCEFIDWLIYLKKKNIWIVRRFVPLFLIWFLASWLEGKKKWLWMLLLCTSPAGSGHISLLSTNCQGKFPPCCGQSGFKASLLAQLRTRYSGVMTASVPPSPPPTDPSVLLNTCAHGGTSRRVAHDGPDRGPRRGDGDSPSAAASAANALLSGQRGATIR